MWVPLKPLRFGGAKSCKRSRQSVSTLLSRYFRSTAASQVSRLHFWLATALVHEARLRGTGEQLAVIHQMRCMITGLVSCRGEFSAPWPMNHGPATKKTGLVSLLG